jgi:hypothetical protein
MAWVTPGANYCWHYRARQYVRAKAPELVGYIEEYWIKHQTDGEIKQLSRALAKAWEPKPLSISRWLMRRRVRKAMPTLAHNLDRLTLQELGIL